MLKDINSIKFDVEDFNNSMLYYISELTKKHNKVVEIINNTLYFNESHKYKFALYEALKELDDSIDLEHLKFIEP